ncbi:hypothetical protein EhV202 [Emiliania huxleyi virus 86]|jgi:hypothetical protein|uniref:Uncharacterized protein n=2 Tax=Emiliania huxleyi virus 86 TaxID=181082 RepID=Q4A2T1_EHV8U|nr:hypothetical protein EhV202 [Emiliania huxleyi virus 86]AEO97597.1 hypothetical protein ENVG_00456 [Emiliania huxleyi virus 84]AEO98082.1 hypothetical protein ELVG_00407 [Emiliania huxleyi virus 203]AEP15225.1 hypothetical protein EOVG_00288 [Emiliania huxleyi virus 88]AEP16261.1 hypothetical protein ERVG_00388 [Emiliania huxleyi virus 208]AET98260.1 hypothetical protein EPVG_00373 [Emiliania huxleyi virus 201]AHA54801.1 hypothetical protein EhV145_00250 [Emiliania huxleyi virus 145]AHA55
MLTTLTITAVSTSLILLEDVQSDADTTIFGEVSWLYKKRHAETPLQKWIYKYRWWQTMLRLQLRLRWLIWPFVGSF